MGILETYSKRRKRLENAGKQDVYQYDDLPHTFRVQVVQILNGALGAYYESGGYSSSRSSPSNRFWSLIHDDVARELGVFTLAQGGDPDDKCRNYLMTADTEGVLDIIEYSFRVIDMGVRDLHPYQKSESKIKQTPDGAIEELNHRFREHGIGYQYVEGILVRLDSQFAHAEIVKPALSLLNAAGFDGPADEFIRAFDHYRHGRNKEAVVEALKAFESTMKAICAERKWFYSSTATAKELMRVLFENGLIPSELESHFTGLRTAMESGLPTVTNRTSGHGQGAVPISIPPHYVAYALHLAASNIVFLLESHKALP